MLLDVNVYSAQLEDLWYKVFGDDKEYISLLFDKGYTPTECFGIIDNGKVVSALYLLGCKIKLKDNIYTGRYLYAAATLNEYRGKGLMAELINESKRYVRESGADFIALVPASESLYHYYGKFGFESLMYNYVSVYEGEQTAVSDEKITFDEAVKIRRNISADSFQFCDDEMKYARLCLEYAGYGFYRNSADSYYIADKDKKDIIEYISSDEDLKVNTEKLFSHIGNAVVVSPYDLSEYCKSEKRKFGMIYSATENIKANITDGIYMNIALD